MRNNDSEKQSAAARSPSVGKYKWHHRKHGLVRANTKSEARARLKERGELGRTPVRRVG